MDITAIFVVGSVILGIYKIFELFIRKKERALLIEKIPVFLNNNQLGDFVSLPGISFGKRDYGSWPLRISLLLIGVGMGCVIAFFIQYYLFDNTLRSVSDEGDIRRQIEQSQFVLYFSFITIFGGLGLLAAYLIELKSKTR
jgi:hypothetical protein